MILVDPRIRFNYATYYIYGLQEVLGEKAVYTTEPFESLRCETLSHYFSGVPVVVNGKKIFIDYCDYDYILNDRYAWCDVYAKVNCTDKQLATLDKLMAIGPGFGIQLASRLQTLWLGLKNYRKCKGKMQIPFDRYMGDYAYSFVRRRRLSRYEQSGNSVDKDYVFHASTLWNKQLADQGANVQRAAFLRVCRQAGLTVDGGLLFLENSGGEMSDYSKYKEKYKDFLLEKRVSPDDYIDKTKRSLCVFSAPSVGLCHGWKLAEYLCMGKAILSVPLTRALPAPLDCLRLVHSPKEMAEAVEELRRNEPLRTKMERESRDYYDTWLAPKAVVNRILKKC